MKIADRIIKYMRLKGYKVFEHDELNIVYVEGLGPDGFLNNDAPDEWNDSRWVIQVVNETNRVLGSWRATTEPGNYYTQRPMNPKGAARIAFGQYKSWKVGIHGNSEPHEALVQVAAVKVHRDFNKDGLRTGDATDEGLFGINQHWGYNMRRIHTASAGCLVGQYRNEHREFMQLVKSDSRFKANSDYIFWTTIIPGDDLFRLT